MNASYASFKRGSGGVMNEQNMVLDAAIIAAARTVRRDDDVIGVSIVMPSHPNYRQLVRYRECEQDLGVRLTIIPRGCIVIEELASHKRSLPPERPVSTLVTIPASHTPHWIHELLMSTEGVR